MKANTSKISNNAPVMNVSFGLDCITVSAKVGKKNIERNYFGFTEYEAKGMFKQVLKQLAS